MEAITKRGKDSYSCDAPYWSRIIW